MGNVFPLRRGDRDKEQAGQWLARIDRGLTVAEQAALKQWLSDPQHRETLFRLAEHWDSMSVVAELAELFPLRESERSIWTGVGRAAAAATVVAAIAGLTLYKYSPLHSTHPVQPPITAVAPGASTFTAHYSTLIGERRTIELPDHSRIQLNTHTELTVTFSQSARLLTMSSGEAMFDVAKDPRRVFTVRVGGYEFKAVGTAFNIRADSPTQVALTVTEGRVRMHRDAPVDARNSFKDGSAPTIFEEAADLEVAANKSVAIAEHSEQINVLTPDQLAEATSWQHGVIVFKATPLEQVLNELARYSTKRFVMATPELASIPVSGYFQVGDFESLSAALQENVGIKVTEENGYLLLSSTPRN